MRNKFLAVIGLLIAIAAAGLFSFDVRREPDLNYFNHPAPIGGDFVVFWSAAKVAAAGPATNVYVPSAMQAQMQTLVGAQFSPIPLFHPAHLIPLLQPFAAFSYFTAYLLFFVLTLALFLSAVWRWAGLWAAFFMLGFSGVWLTLVTGQLGLLYTGLFGWAMWLLPRHALAAGGGIALLTLKPQLGLLWPAVLLAGRQWRVFCATLLALLVVFVGIGLLYGPAIWLKSLEGMLFAGFGLLDARANVQHMPNFFAFANLQGLAAEQGRFMQVALGHAALYFSPDMATRVTLLSFFNGFDVANNNNGAMFRLMPSFSSFLRLQGVAPAMAYSAQGGLLLVVGYYTCKLWRMTQDNQLRLALLATASVATAPFIYNYDLTLLAWPLLVLLLQPKLRWYEAAALALAYFWPMLNYRSVALSQYQLGVFLPLLLLVLVARRIVVSARIT